VREASSEEMILDELVSPSFRVVVVSSKDVEVASTSSPVKVTSVSAMSDPTEDESEVTTESSTNDVLVVLGLSTFDMVSPVCASSVTSVELCGSSPEVEASVVMEEISSVESVLLSNSVVTDTSSSSSLEVGS
jgi:hypothetical protein